MAIIGIDEVGRGCWAGPLVVAAVRLEAPINGLADSKDLSIKKRIELETIIIDQIPHYDRSVVAISPQIIDEVGLTEAMKIACEEAFSSCSKQVSDTVVIDGNINYLPNIKISSAVIKADSSVPAVMAASILAKQSRDAIMHQLSKEFSEFGWETNVGYGTKVHMEALAKYGVTEHHRKSFKPIQKYVSETGEYCRT